MTDNPEPFPAWLAVGARCTWLYMARGGYGYLIPIDATITRLGRARVEIEVKKQSGELVRRWVRPGSLQPLERNG